MNGSKNKKNKIIAFSFVIVAFVLSFLIYDFTYGLNGQKFSIYTGLKNVFGSITKNTSIVNGSFEENVIDSNYERISVNGWYTPKNDNKIAVAKYNSKIDTKYFAELNSEKSNSYYRNLILKKNTNYKFALSHRGRTDARILDWYDYDVLAIILGSNQDISPSLDSNNKDQFMKMTEWLKTSYNTDIASNSISSKYTIYSSKFADGGAFEVDGFSLTETEIYTEKWNIWFVKSSAYSFHDYIVDFNSEELEDCLVSLSSVLTATKIGDRGNLIRKFKLYNEDDVLFDFDPEKISQENKDRLTTLLSKGYTTIAALNGTNPFLTDDWWNVTETKKTIEFGMASASLDPYKLVDLYNNSAFEGNQFAVADNIYQKINIGNNSALKLSFAYKSLSNLTSKYIVVDKQISIFNDTLVPSQNNDTKKTQLDLLSEWIPSFMGSYNKGSKPLIVYTAPFADNGLFTVDVSNAFSFTKDDIHTIPIYYLSYSIGYTNNSWVDFDTIVDLSNTGIDGNIVLYFNSYTSGDESIIIDDVKTELYENRKIFLDSEFDGEGTKESPYLINNEDDFIKLRSYASGLPDSFAQTYFKQTQDIIFTKNLSFKLAPNFAGIYDGRGYYLRDIYINNGSNQFIPTSLFNGVTGTIENLGLKNEVLNGSRSSGIALNLLGGNIRNCYVTDSTFDSLSAGYGTLSGIVNYIYEDSKVSNSYFYGTFKSAQNIAGIGRYTNSNVTFENVFSNIDPNIKANTDSTAPPTIINSSTKTLNEMKNVSFINTLNDYVQNNDSLVAWVIDQDTGLPVFSHETLIPKVSNMYVKMSEDGSNNIYWYNKDNKYFLYLSKNIDRSSMITNFILNSDAIEVYAYDEDDNELGKIENDTPNNYFVKDKVILKLKYNNQMSGNYEVNVMQSDLPSVHLNLNPTETKTAGQLLEEINADRNHDTGFPGVAYIRDAENNLTTASFKK